MECDTLPSADEDIVRSAVTGPGRLVSRSVGWCAMRSERDKMLAGELYDASAPEIQAELAVTHRWLARYNFALDMAPSERHALLVERLGFVGAGAVIRPPF